MAENRKKPEQRQTGRDIHADRAETEWKPGMVRARQIQTDTVKESFGLFGRWKQRRKARKEEKAARTGAGNADAVGSDVCG